MGHTLYGSFILRALKLDKHIFPEKIRVSIGSAAVLGLLECKLDVSPTTVHLMTCNSTPCRANCSFCSQAKKSNSDSALLSRISWPEFKMSNVITNIKEAYLNGIVNRVCIQALNYFGVFNHLNAIVYLIKSFSSIPISVSCQPGNRENILHLAYCGADRIGIPIDVATKKLFADIKGENVGGPYIWELQFEKLRTAIDIFGKGNVSTHLIIGLGESEKEVLVLIQNLRCLGVISALFAFTPIRGTLLEKLDQPSVESYRRIQLAKYLIDNKIVSFNQLCFNNNDQICGYGVDKSILSKIVEFGTPFRTSGCPDCNRPFYNERPSGPLFNFPRDLKTIEIVKIKQLLDLE